MTMANKPTLPKGTRDFSPNEMVKRQYIMETLKKVFQKTGYQPIETPSFENYDTLMGKYGEEGDRLIFKILKSGDYLKKVDDTSLSERDLQKITPSISDKALRYDLTVPFARYVVQNHHELAMPFKRYQIQPVWRADRPQKGRFREFYQCDCDVVGSDSLWQEVELVQIYDEAFAQLNLKTTIRLNNRKILAGLSEFIGEEDRIIDFTVALDKLDKIGEEGVVKELRDKGFSEDSLEKVLKIINLSGSDEQLLDELNQLFVDSAIGQKGIEEMQFILNQSKALGLSSAKLKLDLTLARGLNYYTGAIFEVSSDEVTLGSIGGGGRYDDLTGIFGLKNVSGVGISFGLDRIYLVLEELNKFPSSANTLTQVLFVNFGDIEVLETFKWSRALRSNGVNCEIYPDSSKMKKQFDYANKKSIPYVVIMGSKEIEQKRAMMKNMETGEQIEVNIETLISFLKVK